MQNETAEELRIIAQDAHLDFCDREALRRAANELDAALDLLTLSQTNKPLSSPLTFQMLPQFHVHWNF